MPDSLGTLLRSLLAAAVLVASTSATSAAPPSPAAAGTADRERQSPAPTVAIVGASASAGFGTLMVGPGGDGPGVVPVRLADLLQAIPDASGRVVADWSTAMFFRDPVAIGREAIGRAIASEASLLLGIDFLFWYGYGFGSDATRLGRFEEGLRQLDRFGGPMVLGDLPDMAPAAGGMISAAQVPSLESIAAMNDRLRAWAAERPRVLLLPIGELTRHAFTRAKIPLRTAAKPEVSSPTAGDGEGDPGSAAAAEDPGDAATPGVGVLVSESDRGLGATLQRDRLHPTFDGLVAITWMMLRTVQQHAADLPGLGPMAATASMLSPREFRDRIREGVLRSIELATPATPATPAVEPDAAAAVP
jgi:hypothetical protein